MFSLFNDNPDKLLRHATELKNRGKINEAIEKLKKTYIAISKTQTVYPIDIFLRLPMYLQQANRNDEAWGELNKLLSIGYPNQMKEKELFPMDHCVVYDKMRLFLQREKRFKESMTYGIFSFLSWGIGLYYQKRKEEFKNYFSAENVTIHIRKLVKKAKALDKKDEIVKVVNESINSLPKIDFNQISNEINLILKN